MKLISGTIMMLLIASLYTQAQDFKENQEPLSKNSLKGYLYDITRADDGTSYITYKIRADKKSEDVLFEEYSFDKDLKFLGNKDVKEKKESYEDKEVTGFTAFVGGTTSFDVLSMKLKIQKVVALKKWNHEKQLFITKKIISRENIKPRNDNGKVYLGYASYESSADDNSDLFVLAKAESKDKGQADNFFALVFNSSLDIKETPMDLKGSYSLVYCRQLANDDVVAVFAPNKNAADVSKYVYFRFDIKGKLLSKIEFTSPASALLITAVYEQDGNIFFFGTSTKSTELYNQVFNEYAPIYNPGFTEGGINKLDFKWQKSVEEKMDNFHLLKFDNSKLVFASTTPVSDFKSKFKTAPGDKGASAYKGKRFQVEKFLVTNEGDYLVAGQLMSTINMGTGNRVDSYEDVVCFHFDKSGSLKAQYGIGKLNNDKKSEIFDMKQNFYPSADGKSLYWEILEVKGVKGYEGFLEAYYDAPSYYPLYYPRVGKIDLTTSTLGTFKTLGNGKYFLKRNFIGFYDTTEGSVTYYGNDEGYKNMWIGKLMTR